MNRTTENARNPRRSARAARAVRAALAVACFALALAPAATALDPAKLVSQYGHDVWQRGLPQNTVNAVVQTTDGFLWLGTYEGLVRFDGADFSTFDKRNTPALASNSVVTLCAASDGSLWIGTFLGGLAHRRGSTFDGYTTADGLPGSTVQAITEGADGELWIGTDRGLAQLRAADPGGPAAGGSDRDPGGGGPPGRPAVVGVFGAASGLAGDSVKALLVDRGGTLWVGTTGGLARLDGERFARVGEASHGDVSAIFEDRTGAIWVGWRRGGVDRHAGGATTHFGAADGLASDLVTSVCDDANGNVWIGTEGGGLDRFSGGAFAHYTPREGLSDASVLSLLEDREGSLWVGTNGGLNRLKDEKFTAYTAREGLSNEFARSVFVDGEGTAWVGTDGGGLNVLRGGRATAYTTKDGLSSDLVKSVWRDREGSVWIGTTGGGVDRMRGGRVDVFTTKDGLAGNSVAAIYEDREGAIWVGVEDGGVSRYAGGAFETFGEGEGLGATGVRAICESRDGSMWFGTSGGLYRLAGGAFTAYTTRDGLSNDYVFSIYEDAEGTLFVGTDSGLTVVRDGRFASVTVRDGLYDDKAFWIGEDGSGNLWMSCNKGVYRVDKVALEEFAAGRRSRVECAGFDSADGLRSNQCNGNSQPAGARGPDGRLWFPTAKGVASIDPDTGVRRNPVPPPVEIEQVVADNAPIELGARAELAAGTERVEFHYAGLSFVAPERVRFKFKLEGFDADWIDAGTRRAAYYTNVPPGSYRFRVLACNNDGVWNESGAAFAFRVATPPWRTWWAACLYVLGVGGLAYGGAQLRWRTLQRRNRLLEAGIAERTAELARTIEEVRTSERRARDASRAKSVFLSNMSHELRTPLNAILGFVRLMEREPDRAEEDRRRLAVITNSGEHLLGLINDVLSISKIEAGKLALRERVFGLDATLESVESMFAERAADKGLRMAFEPAPGLPAWTRGDEGKLRQVLVNLLGNAVKFTDRGTVTLRARWAEGRAHFEVEDTGGGIEPDEIGTLFEPFEQAAAGRSAHEGTGLGLAISRDMVRLMGGEICVRSEVGRGTVFLFDVALPAADRPVPVARVRGAVRVAAGQPAPRVLVADDRWENRMLLATILGAAGIETREAADGEAAVAEAAAWRPDAILMDLRMPLVDGYEAARRVRASGARCAIVGLTASAFEHEREAARAAGCDDVITKPFRDEDLFAALASSLGVRFEDEPRGEAWGASGESGAGAGGPSADGAAGEAAGAAPPTGSAREIAGGADEGDRAADLAARLAGLSERERRDLRVAASRGNGAAAERVIAAVRPRDPALADALAALVWGFAFERLAALLDRAELRAAPHEGEGVGPEDSGGSEPGSV